MKFISPLVLFALIGWSCSSQNKPNNFHEPQKLEYQLISMTGHQESLKRDIVVMGADKMRPSLMILYSEWPGKLEWSELNLGQCVSLSNKNPPVITGDDHCTELVSVNGTTNEYLPYVSAKQNFLSNIKPYIAETVEVEAGMVAWKDSKGAELARFKLLGAAK